MHDFEPGWDTYVERPGYCREADIAIADARSGDYEAVFLVGGRAPEYLRNDSRLRGLVREFQEQGKWIFSICHGIQILNAAGIAKGRNLTCYEHVRSEVEACGGTFVAKPCVRDGNMVSAQTWQDHPWFFREVSIARRASLRASRSANPTAPCRAAGRTATGALRAA